MVSYSAARAIVLEYLDSMGSGIDLLEDKTLDLDFGWIFFYQSREYLLSGNVSYALAGNAPLIVDRQTGQLNLTGTAHPIDYYIELYKANSRLG